MTRLLVFAQTRKTLLIMASTLAVLIPLTLSSITVNSGDAQEFNQEGETPLGEAQLIEMALNELYGYGLAEIHEQTITNISMRDWWMTMYMPEGIENPDHPVFLLSVKGDGIWNGFGASHNPDPETRRFDSVTVALDGITGRTMIVSTGHSDHLLAETTDEHYQLLDELIRNPPSPSFGPDDDEPIYYEGEQVTDLIPLPPAP